MKVAKKCCWPMKLLFATKELNRNLHKAREQSFQIKISRAGNI